MKSWDRRLAAATRVDNARTTAPGRAESFDLPVGLHHDDIETVDVLFRRAGVSARNYSTTILGRVSDEATDRNRLVEITVMSNEAGADVLVSDTTPPIDTDRLTGLHGRDHLIAEIETAISACGPAGQSVGVFHIDIDRFKAVNDTHGYKVGDRLLTLVTARLSGSLRPDDCLARIGGDGFAIVCPDVQGPAEAAAIAEQFRSICADAPDDSLLPELTLSVGYTIGSKHSDGATLLRESETALYNAKGLGRDRCELFDDDLRGRVERRLSVDQRLRNALDENAIEVHYQPIIELESNLIVGAEALLRIRGEDGKHLNPRELVSAAEDSGLIRRIEETVMNHAVATLESMPDAATSPLFMSINISDQRLTDSRFPLSLARTLHNAGASADQIHLEIHPAALSGSSTGTRLMTQLRALGVTVVIDELSHTMEGDYVNQKTVGCVKLDQRVIQAIHGERGRARARLVIEAITERGIDVCAVGIETDADLQAVTDLGCRFGQGYLFSPPINRLKLAELVSQQGSLRADC